MKADVVLFCLFPCFPISRFFDNDFTETALFDPHAGCELWASPSEELGRWPILQASLLLVNSATAAFPTTSPFYA